MYIKYNNYKAGTPVNDGDSILMSLQDFLDGGKNITHVPITITPDGSPPDETPEAEEMEEIE